MAKMGKRTRAAREAFADKENLSVDEAVALVKSNATAKFDETVEIAMQLGIDPRHADQMVRGVVSLPNGTGKTVRVAVFAKDAKADEAKAAGADIVATFRISRGTAALRSSRPTRAKRSSRRGSPSARGTIRPRRRSRWCGGWTWMRCW